MAYVRKKRTGTTEYYQLVESRRVDGKPRQRVIMHLGEYPSVEAAIEGLPEEIAWFHKHPTSSRKALAKREEKLRALKGLREGGNV